MTQTSWKTEIDLLIKYIKENPEIIINKCEVSIPKDLRDEFYGRFDKIREAMVEDFYSALPLNVEALSNKFMKIEEEIMDLLKIDSISMPVDLSRFLHNPKEGLMRVLYSRLFDLLQGKTAFDDFEQCARNDILSTSHDLYRLGYEHWAALSLIKTLEPDEAFQVDFDPECRPCLTEMKWIAFGRQALHPTLRIPEFVIHSGKIGRYIAVKMALVREIGNIFIAHPPPVRPKRPSGDTSLAMDSRAMILSLLSKPDDIPILAEIYERKIVSPDLIVEFFASGELWNPGSIDQVRLHAEILQPKRGICLLAMDPEEKAPDALPDGLFAHTVGLDLSKLNPVAAMLV